MGLKFQSFDEAASAPRQPVAPQPAPRQSSSLPNWDDPDDMVEGPVEDFQEPQFSKPDPRPAPQPAPPPPPAPERRVHDARQIARVTYGAVLFDEGKAGSGGWAARPGEAAFRIQGPGDLGTQSLWLTNVEYAEFRAGGLAQNPWLRHSGYLRLSLHALLEEWNLAPAGPTEKAERVSEIVDRVLRQAARLLGTQDRFRGTSLSADLGTLLPAQEAPPEDAVTAISHAIQPWTKTQLRKPFDTTAVTVRYPRLAYVGTLLQSDVPVGPWEWMPASVMPPNPAKRAEWLLGLGRPVLARVTVNKPRDDVPADYASILAFGAGARDRTDNLVRRNFAAAPELEAMNSLFELNVDGAWVGRGVVPYLHPEHPVIQALQDPQALMSWSMGVLAENILAAAMRPLRTQRSQQPSEEEGSASIYPFAAAWLRSADRVMTFDAAVRLYDQGYVPMSYSLGSVRVAVAAPQIPNLVRGAFRLGLLPPLSVSTTEAVRALPAPPMEAWGGSEDACIEAFLRVTGNEQALRDLDAMPDMTPEDAQALIRALIGD